MSRASGTGEADRHPRFGIEEEFFLLDPADGSALPVSAEVMGSMPARARAHAQSEFLATQVEHATAICTSASGAREQLLAFRADLAVAASASGAIAAGTGTPFRAEAHPTLSPGARYAELADRHRALVEEHQVAALHVHVEVPDRDAGVGALRMLAAWLPMLKAVAGNSPWWDGRDTGFASWRTILLRRWTTAGCPPAVFTSDEYGARAAALIGVGGTRDEATIAWDVRLSARYPTVELRVADAQSTAHEALVIALITRGLVSAAIRRPDAVPGFASELVDAACWHTARFGVSEGVVAPGGGGLVSFDEAASLLVDALEASAEDVDLIRQGLHRVSEHGTGAQRQRGAAEHGGWAGLREHLSRDLVAG